MPELSLQVPSYLLDLSQSLTQGFSLTDDEKERTVKAVNAISKEEKIKIRDILKDPDKVGNLLPDYFITDICEKIIEIFKKIAKQSNTVQYGSLSSNVADNIEKAIEYAGKFNMGSKMINALNELFPNASIAKRGMKKKGGGGRESVGFDIMWWVVVLCNILVHHYGITILNILEASGTFSGPTFDWVILSRSVIKVMLAQRLAIHTISKIPNESMRIVLDKAPMFSEKIIANIAIIALLGMIYNTVTNASSDIFQEDFPHPGTKALRETVMKDDAIIIFNWFESLFKDIGLWNTAMTHLSESAREIYNLFGAGSALSTEADLARYNLAVWVISSTMLCLGTIISDLYQNLGSTVSNARNAAGRRNVAALSAKRGDSRSKKKKGGGNKRLSKNKKSTRNKRLSKKKKGGGKKRSLRKKK